MKKSKGQTIDLLYTNKKEVNTKSKSKSTTKKKNNKTKKVQGNNNIINLDNEIIIGLTRKNNESKKPKKNSKQTNKKATNVKSNKSNSNKNKQKNTKKRNTTKKTQQNQKNKRKVKIIKWIFVIVLIAVAIALFMMSSVFNIKEIVVINNSKVSSEEIINLSSLTTGINMFKITNGTIKDGIKTNAYIEEVNVKRSINGKITLDIKERQATYMLKFANAYVYINNQGYILETSENPAELPIITGFMTLNEEMKIGNRLSNEDLKKLDDVIKIMEVSKNTPLSNTITEIDISNSPDYKLKVESQMKTIRIGDMVNINIKLQMAGEVFAAEEGKIGEIYFQDDGKKAIFKEEVSR